MMCRKGQVTIQFGCCHGYAIVCSKQCLIPFIIIDYVLSFIIIDYVLCINLNYLILFLE